MVAAAAAGVVVVVVVVGFAGFGGGLAGGEMSNPLDAAAGTGVDSYGGRNGDTWDDLTASPSSSFPSQIEIQLYRKSLTYVVSGDRCTFS